MLQTHQMSRTVIYIRVDIKYKRRTDLEINGDSNIWLTIYPYRQKPYNILSFYREWQEVNSEGIIPKTNDIQSQLS